MSLLVPLLLAGLSSRHPVCEPRPGERSPASNDFQGALTETFDPDGAGLVDRFFAALPVCELKEFLADGTVGRAFVRAGTIEREDLLVLHDELAGDRAGLPHRRYYGDPAERTALRNEILVLATRMAELGTARLNLSMLTSKASALLELRTTQERISVPVAVKIHCVRTHGAYVLDTWRENGGEPGHVLRLKDWLERNDEADVVGLE